MREHSASMASARRNKSTSWLVSSGYSRVKSAAASSRLASASLYLTSHRAAYSAASTSVRRCWSRGSTVRRRSRASSATCIVLSATSGSRAQCRVVRSHSFGVCGRIGFGNGAFSFADQRRKIRMAFRPMPPVETLWPPPLVSGSEGCPAIRSVLAFSIIGDASKIRNAAANDFNEQNARALPARPAVRRARLLARRPSAPRS